MTSEEYPYLAQLSVPDRLRLAAYEARDHGVPAVHVRAILDVAEELESLGARLLGDKAILLQSWTEAAGEGAASEGLRAYSGQVDHELRHQVANFIIERQGVEHRYAERAS